MPVMGGDYPRPVGKSLFTRRDAWTGAYYELAFCRYPASDGVNDLAPLVWSREDISGPYSSNELEPSEQIPLDPSAAASPGKFYGVAHLPNGTDCPCATSTIGIDYPFHNELEKVTEWFALGIPMGGLSNAGVDVGAYPFDDTIDWMPPIDQWLADIALSAAHANIGFSYALIGHDVSGNEQPDTPTRHLKSIDTEGFHQPTAST